MNKLDWKFINYNNKILPSWLFWLFVILLLIWISYIDFLNSRFIEKIYNNFVEFDNSIIIILAVIGWIVALILQRKNIKDQLNAEIKYDVYKQFVVLHKEIQRVIAELSTKISPPFIEMKSCMISFEVKLKTEPEALLDGNNKWLEYLRLVLTNYFEFSDKYIDLLYMLEDWTGPIKNLCKTIDIFKKEIDNQKNQIYNYINKLQFYSNDHGYDWRKWNNDEINKITEDTKQKLFDISCYLSDLMVLIHNELLSKYFKYFRPTRKTLDEKYKVLKKEGFIINLETNKEKIAKFKKLLQKSTS